MVLLLAGSDVFSSEAFGGRLRDGQAIFMVHDTPYSRSYGQAWVMGRLYLLFGTVGGRRLQEGIDSDDDEMILDSSQGLRPVPLSFTFTIGPSERVATLTAMCSGRTAFGHSFDALSKVAYNCMRGANEPSAKAGAMTSTAPEAISSQDQGHDTGPLMTAV